jgi:hypothetical protein
LYPRDFATRQKVGESAPIQWHFCNCYPQTHYRPKKQHNSAKNQFRLKALGALPKLSVFVRCAAAIWVGNPMKNAIVASLPDELFIIRVDGRIRSHHRRFLDALREGLHLRDQFPQHDVKVQSMQMQRKSALH